MAVCEELSVQDLWKIQVPRCGCLHQISTAAYSDLQVDSSLHDILAFVEGLTYAKTEEKPVMPTEPNSDVLPQMFFGISLDQEVDSPMKHLTCFVQSQMNCQQRVLESVKSPGLIPTSTHMDWNLSRPPAITSVTYILSPSAQQPHVFSSSQVSLINPSSQKSVPTPLQYHKFREGETLISKNTQISSAYSSSQEPASLVSPSNPYLDLDLQLLSSHTCKKFQEYKFFANNHMSFHNAKIKTDQMEKTSCKAKTCESFSKEYNKKSFGSRYEQQSKKASVSYKGSQNKDISRSRSDEEKPYKLPFISTDEQENRDNEVS